MEQFVKLTVYQKLLDGSYGTISMKLSDIKDNTGTPISLLLPGIKSTLTLSLKPTMVFSVDNCSLQEWEVIDAGRATMHTEGEGQIEINVYSLDTERYKKIQSIKLISSGKEYRAIVTSISLSTSPFSALTENLKELPEHLDNQSQLIIYMTDNSMWKIPFSMYQYRYDENRLILTIDSKAF
jgi:hypothetical protein